MEREVLKRLIEEKDAVEKEIIRLSRELENAPGSPGVKGSLVDREGFPRGDVDVVWARELRHKIALLQTDHMNLMKRIEDGLGSALEEDSAAPKDTTDWNQVAAIALLGEVALNSPAFVAGWQMGDKVLHFGPFKEGKNKYGIRQISEFIEEHVDVEIPVMLRRGSVVLSRPIVPHKWEGRGVLGMLVSSRGTSLPYDAGNYDLCEDTTGAHYCMSRFTALLNDGVMMSSGLGLCVPQSCSFSDVSQLLPKFLEDTHATPINAATICPDEYQPPLRRGYWAAISILIILCCLVISGTVVEFYERYNKYDDSEYNPLVLPTAFEEDSPMPYTYLGVSTGNNHILHKSILYFLKCFSIWHNTYGLMTSDVKKASSYTREIRSICLECLNGLRVLSILWIMLGETVLLGLQTTGYYNPETIFGSSGESTKWYFQILVSSDYAVDTFFFLSGFLAAHCLLTEMDSTGGRFSLFRFYFHKFLRVAPSYYLVLLIYSNFSIFVGNGPFWYRYKPFVVDACDKYWWTNMLFVNNFYPCAFSNVCMNWSWFLANYMQFMIILPILIYVFYKHRAWGWGLLLSLIGGCLVVTGIFVRKFQLNTYYFDDDRHMYDDYEFEKPHLRFPVFAIGVGMVFLIDQLHVSRTQYWEFSYPDRFPFRIGIYVLSSLLLLCCVGSQYFNYHSGGKDWSGGDWNNFFYILLSKLAWTVGIALLTYLPMLGYGGPLKYFLECRIWAVFSKLTFGVYLIHPVLMYVLMFSSRRFADYHSTPLTANFMLFSVLSFLLSYFLYLIAERPVMNLEKLLFAAVRHLMRKRGRRF